MIAAVYARKSTDQGAVSDEQRSVTRQVEHARAFAEARGWTVDDTHVYVDDGISGAEFDARPGFVRLLNALKPKAGFDVLVMAEESRLGREAIETAYALKQLIQAGVQVWFYLEGRQRTLDSPTDKLLLSVTAFADELEREKARQRTYDAMVRKARAGHVCGGRVFGYDNVEITLADGTRSHVERRINETEAAVVRRIFELYADGYGFTAIAKLLNGDGAASPRAQQGRPQGWVSSSVRLVLHRELYRGVLVWNQTRKRNVWGQVKPSRRTQAERIAVDMADLRIVDETRWQAVQRRLAEVRGRALRTRKGHILGRPPGTTAKYLLSGLLQCACCGGMLEARTRSHGRQRVLFYGCSSYHKKGRTVCTNSLTLPAATFEETVLAAVEDRVLDPAIVEEAITLAVAQLQARPVVDPREAHEAALQAVERELQSLTAAVAAGGALPPLLEAIRTREADRQRLTADLALRQTDQVARQFDPATLRRQLTERIADWRALVRGQVTQGRQLLRRLLVGPLVCEPQPSRCYRLTGTATVGKLVEGWVPLMVASPTGFEPVFQP